jgi:hypothetical protein
MKIRLVGAELFHADGRMDRHDEVKSLLDILRTRLKMIMMWDTRLSYTDKENSEGWVDHIYILQWYIMSHVSALSTNDHKAW